MNGLPIGSRTVRDSFALSLQAVAETGDPLAQLPVGRALRHAAKPVECVAVVQGRLCSAAVRCDVEVGHGVGEQELERLRDVNRQPPIRPMDVNAFVDPAEQ